MFVYKDYTNRLVKFAINTPDEDIPSELYDIAKERFIDIIGVAMAGTSFQGAKIATDLIREEGGHSRSTAWGFGFKTSIAQAALINGISAHAPDYDDITLIPMNHQSVVLVPTVLTIGEALRSSGKEVLSAYIMGYEFEAKVGLSVMPEHLWLGWHPPCTLGTLAAAIASARLLKATDKQACVAVGIAASMASGIRKNVGTMTKGFHAGHSARCGIQAAQLAVNGYTASLDVLDTKPVNGHDYFSFQKTFNQGIDKKIEDDIIDSLGDPWELSLPKITVKIFPGATSRFGVISELINVSIKENLKAEEIKEIRLGVNTILNTLASYAIPESGLRARYSLIYSAASAVVNRKAGLKEYTDTSSQDPVVASLMQRIQVYKAPEFDNVTETEQSFAIIDLECYDGREYHLKPTYAPGFPQNPITYKCLISKFYDCANFGGYTKKQANKIKNLIEDLDNLPNIDNLTNVLGLKV
jgi:2-methylcitrate dehydratase PrpD